MPKAKLNNLNDPVYRNTHTLRTWLWNYEPNYKILKMYLDVMISMQDHDLSLFIQTHFTIKDQMNYLQVDWDYVKQEFEDHLTEL